MERKPTGLKLGRLVFLRSSISPSHWQLLREHLRNVAHLAKQFAEPLGLAAEAELAGLLHDIQAIAALPDLPPYARSIPCY